MALFGPGIAGALLLFFPQRWLLSQVEQTHPGDRLSTEYRSPDPLTTGRHGAAAGIGPPVSGRTTMAGSRPYPAAAPRDASDPEPRSAARLLAFDSLAGQFVATQEGAGERASLLQQLVTGTPQRTDLVSLADTCQPAEGQQQAGIAEFAFRKLTEIHPDQACCG